jgi:hypothetical protein
VRELLDAVAKARVPCISIMNMPPLPYLARIPGVALDSLRSSYTDASVWDSFDPKLMTLCSPDPQAFRPPEEKVNVLEVRLPTNFKAARFDSDAHTTILRRLESDIEAARFETSTGKIELPVKLKVHDSIFVPLAKWAMLLAGNYRCVQKDGMRSIKEAVHANIEESQSVYEWVVALCRSPGAAGNDLVPFENTPTRRFRCLARPLPRERWPPARPTSNAPTASCKRLRRRRECEMASSIRPLRWSTTGCGAIVVDGRDQPLNTRARAIELSLSRDPRQKKETSCRGLIGSARIAR